MSGPRPKKSFLNIADYKLPANETKAERVAHRMNWNESAFGASPMAIAAFKKASQDIFCYPEMWSSSLARSLADKYELDPERVVCGTGSEAILYWTALAYLNPGDEVVSSEYGYYLYKLATEHMGGIPVMVRETDDYKVDIDALIDAVTEKTKIVFVTNPANPTGTLLPAAEIFRLHDALPAHVLLVIDAAYAEYVEERDDYDDYFALTDRSTNNVLITRSFSKIYGLAGLRIGWSYGSPSVARVLRNFDHSHLVSTPAQDAARAALMDTEFVKEVRAYNSEWLKVFNTELRQLGLNIMESHTNFITIYFEGDDRVKMAADLALYLRKENILISELGGYDLPGAIRITIGRVAANKKCIQKIKDFLQLV